MSSCSYDFPPNEVFPTLRKLHKQYGPLLRMRFAGRDCLVIGNRKVAKDLLDKRGLIYSSRPRLVMGLELMNGGDHFFFLPYGPKWKRQNYILTSFLNPRAVKHYRLLQEMECLQTLQHLPTATDYQDCFIRFQSSLVHALAYGSRIPDYNDPNLQEIHEISRANIQTVTTHQWLIDSYPILKHLPKCVSPWKRLGDRMHAQIIRVFGDRTAAAAKTKYWNWTKHTQSLKEAEGMSNHELIYLTGSIYQAGVEIISSYLRLLLMTCPLYPDAVRKAQAELDTVVGSERLPTFDDMTHLPYLDAFLKELIRWRPLAALGAPHSVTQDDSYEGYDIPKNTVLIPNQIAMEFDSEVWESPEEFQPERWLQNPKASHASFGFGRRRCTGETMALESLFIMASRILWTFNIDHAYNENGERMEIDPWGFNESASVLLPKPFKVDIRFRDDHHRDVMNSAWERVEKNPEPYLRSIGEAFAQM
ncbi:hypothetical protein AbraIFM66950_008208 [Aspergillus brasiliensis]|nr:hypothetical protein AbraIFM66950_008208 [Aspergillus brasiliensis]